MPLDTSPSATGDWLVVFVVSRSMSATYKCRALSHMSHVLKFRVVYKRNQKATFVIASEINL
eukprot:5628827-Amphidinium_carterae.1